MEDAFEERRAALRDELAAEGIAGEAAEELLESRDEYTAEGLFWVPPEARWGYLRERAKQPEIGKLIDNAMDQIELDNPSLRGVLPKTYALPSLDIRRLGELVDLISGIGLGSAIQRVPIHDLASLTVRLPPLADHRTIGRRFLAFEKSSRHIASSQHVCRTCAVSTSWWPSRVAALTTSAIQMAALGRRSHMAASGPPLACDLAEPPWRVNLRVHRVLRRAAYWNIATFTTEAVA